MTTQEKLVRGKISLLELAEYLNNVSQACKINGVSRQHFYDIRKAYEEHGLEGLAEKTRKKPCMKKRVSHETEETVLRMANVSSSLLSLKKRTSEIHIFSDHMSSLLRSGKWCVLDKPGR
jgi:transposase